MEQLRSLGRDLAMGSQAAWMQSKEFLDLVKAIGEAKSKAEEDRIVLGEVDTLKKRIIEPDVPRRKMKEYIMRLIYVEMLGHDASFGYIHAVKMTHDDSLLLKKVGYLAVTLFLDDSHELIILIVNTIQKDLRSDNHLIVCAALGAVCKLINEETIPAVLQQVIDLLGHSKETVRKKAVMALHRFYQRSPSSVSHVVPRFRQVLCDKDPSVMSAALCALHELVMAEAAPYKNLTASFVSILKQVAEHRLPKPFDYHRTPAPFIQIKILKILALLGVGDKQASENMYSTLADVLRKGDTGVNIGNAILYECICTVTSIYPNTKLLESSADITSRFLKSDSHNLKYMGIDALGRVVKINPEFATEHQLAVIDCLEDKDDTLKRKTLDLLYTMTKSSNVEVIVERMITYMRTVTDKHIKTEIADRIIELAERFAPNNHWFIQTMNSVFELAGDLVRPGVAHDLMRLIAEGTGDEDEDADNELRASAVESYLKLLEEPNLPSILLQVICWVLGEYGTITGGHSANEIIDRLVDVALSYPSDDRVRGYVITAITKICAFETASSGVPHQLIPEAQRLMEEMLAAQSTDLQQRAYEQQALLSLPPEVIAAVMPMDASCEDIEVDKNLSFLDAYVADALAKGAQPYIPESERDGSNVGSQAGLLGTDSEPAGPHQRSLRFEAYAAPSLPTPSSASSFPSPSRGEGGSDRGFLDLDQGRRLIESTIGELRASSSALVDPSQPALRLDGVQRKWGRSAAPSSSPAPGGGSSSSSNGRTHGADSLHGHGASSSATTSSSAYEPSRSSFHDRRKKEPEVSEEKLRLASSLFGGPSAKSAAKPSAAPHPKPTQKPPVQAAAKSPKPATPPPPPPVDLLDLSDDPDPVMPPSALANPAPVNDPFNQLAGLLDAPNPPAPLPAKPAAPSLDLLSLYGDIVPPVSAPVPVVPDSQPARPIPSNGSVSVSPAGGAVPKKGAGGAASVQRDVVSQKVGVSKDGKSPELFKDLLG